jgi:hypothetical protein
MGTLALPHTYPARLRSSGLLPHDQPFKPEPPLHRWRYSPGFRLLTFASVGVSAVSFGAAHLSNPGATAWGATAIALEAGLLFAALYAVTRSLWWCIGLHFAWNMLQGPVYGSVVSGSGSAAGWLRADFNGPAWLTGGQFGIEASVVAATLLTAVAVWLLVTLHREALAVRPGWVRRYRLRQRKAVPGHLVGGDAGPG